MRNTTIIGPIPKVGNFTEKADKIGWSCQTIEMRMHQNNSFVKGLKDHIFISFTDSMKAVDNYLLDLNPNFYHEIKVVQLAKLKHVIAVTDYPLFYDEKLLLTDPVEIFHLCEIVKNIDTRKFAYPSGYLRLIPYKEI